MATSLLSIVKVKGEKKLQIAYITAQRQYVQRPLNDSQLSLALLAKKQEAIDSLKNVEVEFEEENGQPIKVREKGKEWDHPEPDLSKVLEIKPQTQNDTRDQPDEAFHNPYNFVPALSRDAAKGSELGDCNPLKIGMGHGVYQSDRWSGRISITLTTKTPLLIPDICDSEEESHKTFPLRIGADGKPYLPPTSIKGMLRSAYEAVTNSRLGVFEKHSDQLIYRMEARETGIIPARVEQGRNGRLKFHLMQAVKLPRYTTLLIYGDSEAQDSSSSKKPKLKSEKTSLTPQHGDPVWIKHTAKKVVTHIQKRDLNLINPPDYDWKEGWVWIANHNIDGKKYERVFIKSDDYDDIQIDANMISMWKELIQNYKNEHIKDLKNRDNDGVAYDAFIGNKPGETAFSRHIYEPDYETLKEGSLCFVELGSDEKVEALLPVTLSRHFYKHSPAEILHDSLKPSQNINLLSPADRVFGWVNQHENGKGAYKGNLRIHSVKCSSDDSIHEFDGDGLPLAILGQPKPQQARFYVARDDEGTRLKDGVEKQTGYSKNAKSLRGRKVYPHHQLPLDIQEYSQNERSDQNRSIRAWVKPDVEFTFDIDVTNLSDVELGGLLWLLTLPKGHYHRLGGGKPFGFGSVSLAINWDNTDLRKGDRWKEFYSDLSLIANTNSEQPQGTVEIFQKEVEAVYGNGSFQNAKFIKTFCQAAQGFADGKPIHYPRRKRLRDPENKIFEWFVENESTRGQKLSLPDLTDDRGLPYYP